MLSNVLLGSIDTSSLLTVDVLRNEHQVYEEKEAEHTKKHILHILQVRQTVSDSATKHNDIGVEEHKVADPLMEFTNVRGSLGRRPLLVSIVEAHICCGQSTGNACNDCRKVADCAENRVYVIGPSKAEDHANLKCLPNRDDECDDADENVNHVPELPVALVVALGGQ